MNRPNLSDEPSFMQRLLWRLAVAALLVYLAIPFIPTRYRDACMYRTVGCTAEEWQAIEDSARSPTMIRAALTRAGGGSCYSVDDLRRMIHIDYSHDHERARFDVEVWVLGTWMTAACDEQLKKFADKMAEELQASHPPRK